MTQQFLEDSLRLEIHYLEKHLDELVKGKTMGKMLRHVLLLIAPICSSAKISTFRR